MISDNDLSVTATSAMPTVADRLDSIHGTIQDCLGMAGQLHEAVYGPRPTAEPECNLVGCGLTGRCGEVQDDASRLYSLLIDIKRGLK